MFVCVEYYSHAKNLLRQISLHYTLDLLTITKNSPLNLLIDYWLLRLIIFPLLTCLLTLIRSFYYSLQWPLTKSIEHLLQTEITYVRLMTLELWTKIINYSIIVGSRRFPSKGVEILTIVMNNLLLIIDYFTSMWVFNFKSRFWLCSVAANIQLKCYIHLWISKNLSFFAYIHIVCTDILKYSSKIWFDWSGWSGK